MYHAKRVEVKVEKQKVSLFKKWDLRSRIRELKVERWVLSPNLYLKDMSKQIFPKIHR